MFYSDEKGGEKKARFDGYDIIHKCGLFVPVSGSVYRLFKEKVFYPRMVLGKFGK